MTYALLCDRCGEAVPVGCWAVHRGQLCKGDMNKDEYFRRIGCGLPAGFDWPRTTPGDAMNTTLPTGEPHCPVCRAELGRRLVGRHERRTCPNGHGSAVARLNGMYDGYEWVFTPTKETV